MDQSLMDDVRGECSGSIVGIKCCLLNVYDSTHDTRVDDPSDGTEGTLGTHCSLHANARYGPARMTCSRGISDLHPRDPGLESIWQQLLKCPIRTMIERLMSECIRYREEE